MVKVPQGGRRPRNTRPQSPERRPSCRPRHDAPRKPRTGSLVRPELRRPRCIHGGRSVLVTRQVRSRHRNSSHEPGRSALEAGRPDQEQGPISPVQTMRDRLTSSASFGRSIT
jgi:hypothetical protein